MNFRIKAQEAGRRAGVACAGDKRCAGMDGAKAASDLWEPLVQQCFDALRETANTRAVPRSVGYALQACREALGA